MFRSLGCVGLLACFVACNSGPKTVTVARLLVNVPPEMDADTAVRDGIRADILEALDTDATTRVKLDEANGTHLLRVDIATPQPPNVRAHRPDDDEDQPTEAPQQRVRVELKPREKAPGYDVIGRAPVTGNVRADAAKAFTDAWTTAIAMRRLDTADERDMISALASSDERLQLFAVQRLGDRKSKAAVEPLTRLLNENTRPELALRAIGALINIGDPRAAEPMIELAHNKDPQFVLQVVFALGALGGPTAEGYLVTLASGHPVEAVRRGAEDALAELARRAPKK
jgi:hypothetical protein